MCTRHVNLHFKLEFASPFGSVKAGLCALIASIHSYEISLLGADFSTSVEHLKTEHYGALLSAKMFFRAAQTYCRQWSCWACYQSFLL